MKRLPAGHAVLIQADEETTLHAEPGKPYRINMFQSRSAIRNDLYAIMWEAGLLTSPRHKAYETQVISFFSTQGGCGRMTLAYLTALRLASSGKTAYLNLEPFPCVDTLYSLQQGRRGREFLAEVKSWANAERILSALRINEHGVYVLSLAASIRDRATVEQSDVDYLLKTLLEGAELKHLIIDLGSAMGAIEQCAMEYSDRVAVVYNDDRMGEAKRKQLENDPNYTAYPFAGREIWVGNRCKKEYRDGRFDVCFPISSSLGMLDDLRALLAGNPSFAGGCDIIAQL